MKTTTIGNLVLLFGIFAIALAADATPLTNPIVNPENGHTYYLLYQNTWTASEAEAVTLGGHLATVNDQSENDWVYTTFATYGGASRNLWIGLTDQEAEGTFKWISGETASFRYWGTVDPNNSGNEDYVHMFSPNWVDPNNSNPSGVDPNPVGSWNDYGDVNNFYGTPTFGVVELASVPDGGATFVLLGAGLSGLAGIKRKLLSRNHAVRFGISR